MAETGYSLTESGLRNIREAVARSRDEPRFSRGPHRDTPGNPGRHTAVMRITGPVQTSGYYPAVWVLMRGDLASKQEQPGKCWAWPLDDQILLEDYDYSGFETGFFDNRPVFWVTGYAHVWQELSPLGATLLSDGAPRFIGGALIVNRTQIYDVSYGISAQGQGCPVGIIEMGLTIDGIGLTGTTTWISCFDGNLNFHTVFNRYLALYMTKGTVLRVLGVRSGDWAIDPYVGIEASYISILSVG